MADVTFGVKVTPEIKSEIEYFIKESDFETHKEWFQHVLSIYKLHQLKHQDGTRRYAGDLNHIDSSLTRIQETIVEMMKKAADEAAHYEAESQKAIDALQQQLQQNELKRKEQETNLKEMEEQANHHTKNLTELQKQYGIVEELCSTLKKSLSERETEIENLRSEQNKLQSLDYPSTIQRLTDENHRLTQEIQKQEHKIDRQQIVHENILEVERLRLDFAKKEIALLLQNQRTFQEPDTQTQTPNTQQKIGTGKPGPGRPKKENPRLSEPLTSVSDDSVGPKPIEEFDLPETPEDIHGLLDDEPSPQSNNE